MKHLINFEDFAYHSEISEKDAILKRSERNKEEIERYKCYKCKSQINKPVYNFSLSEIPRLF